MVLAKPLGMKPRDLAEKLIAALPAWHEAQAHIDRLLAPADPQALRDALKRLS